MEQAIPPKVLAWLETVFTLEYVTPGYGWLTYNDEFEHEFPWPHHRPPTFEEALLALADWEGRLGAPHGH